MRKIFTSGILCLYLFTLWSCSDRIDLPENPASTPKSITSLRRVKLSDQLQFGQTAIKAIVVSDTEGKNITEGMIVVQEEGKDAAILLETNNSSVQFPAGTEVEINLEGAELSEREGELVASGISSDHIKATGKTVDVTPKSTNLPTLLLNAEYWGPILVKLEKIELTGGNDGKFSGELTLNDGIGTIHATILPQAAFGNTDLPGYVEAFTGILRMKEGRFFVNPRNLDDVQVGLTELLEDFEGASSTNYNLKTLDFKTGSWIVDGGITANTSADPKNGLQSIRLQGTIGNPQRNGILAMGFDVKGVKRIKVSHGIYPAAAETSNVNPTTIDVEISRDGGSTYTLLETLEIDTKSAALKTNEILVNAGFSENVRFRVVNSSTPFANQNRPRVNIDDVLFIF